MTETAREEAVRGFESIGPFHPRAPSMPPVAISGYVFSGAEADNPAGLKIALSLGPTRCLRKLFTPAHC